MTYKIRLRPRIAYTRDPRRRKDLAPTWRAHVRLAGSISPRFVVAEPVIEESEAQQMRRESKRSDEKNSLRIRKIISSFLQLGFYAENQEEDRFILT